MPRSSTEPSSVTSIAEDPTSLFSTATQSKTPMVVTAAATSAITEQSPWIVRTSFTLPQVTVPMADWAAKNGIKSAVTGQRDGGLVQAVLQLEGRHMHAPGSRTPAR